MFFFFNKIIRMVKVFGTEWIATLQTIIIINTIIVVIMISFLWTITNNQGFQEINFHLITDE